MIYRDDFEKNNWYMFICAKMEEKHSNIIYGSLLVWCNGGDKEKKTKKFDVASVGLFSHSYKDGTNLGNILKMSFKI